jgi:acyl-CoA thioesterase FadM
MGRIKLNLPKAFIFETTVQVQIGDINYGGHMGNDVYLRLAHEARIQFLMAHGWSEKDIDGFGLIMTDAAIQFQAEVFRGDGIKIQLALDDVSKVGFDLYYLFTDVNSSKAVAKIKTGMRFFDYDLRKICSASHPVIERLLALCK